MGGTELSVGGRGLAPRLVAELGIGGAGPRKALLTSAAPRSRPLSSPESLVAGTELWGPQGELSPPPASQQGLDPGNRPVS